MRDIHETYINYNGSFFERMIFSVTVVILIYTNIKHGLSNKQRTALIHTWVKILELNRVVSVCACHIISMHIRWVVMR